MTTPAAAESPSPSAPRRARDRVRDQITSEILEVARDHIGREGAAALSMRSVARELGMAPSALYRYFDGRDALLSALILSSYHSLADVAEGVVPAPDGDARRWCAVPRALRTWALDHPHEWGLIFGTPVPGYEAPPETIEPYTRLAAALTRPVIEAERAGRLRSQNAAHGARREPDALEAALVPVAESLFPGAALETVVSATEAWASVIGLISLEVFGHWRNTILDPEQFFERAIGDLAAGIGLA